MWNPNHSTTNCFQLFDFFVFSRLQRVPKNASIARFHGYSHTESRYPPRRPPHGAEFVWFVKVVCTLCIRRLPSLGIFSSHYFRKNLNPLIAFDVVKHINDKFNDPKLAFNFFHFTRLNLNLIHSLPTYNLLLRSLCQMGLQDLAKLVFEYMRIDGYLPDGSILGFLVLSCAHVGKFEVAKEILIAQANSNNENVDVINSYVYNNFLSLLVKQNRLDEAVGFFRDHILSSQCYCPDTCTFNIVIRGLCRRGEVDTAFEFFNDMGSFGCLPDVMTYNALVYGLCRVGNVDRAHELLREIQSRDGLSPDYVTYTNIISGYCKLRLLEEASDLFHKMISHGIKPSSFTFNALIDGFGKMGDMVSALNMYGRMTIFGCHPDVVTFTSLIDGQCRNGQVDHGLMLWNEMNARTLSPNAYTFSILINALCKENRLNEAYDFLRQLELRRDIVLQPFMFNPVIDGFCKAGNIDQANAIVSEMEESSCNPDKVTFTILILGHCMKGRMLEAISIFNKMLAVGCAPDIITIKCLISCLLKAGMPNEAFRIKQTAIKDLNLGISSVRRPIPFGTNMDIPVAV